MTMSASLPQEELRDLYRELILDHARAPRHFGRLENTSHTAEGINPLCGDKLKLYLQIDSDRTITDVRFEGSGCAISVASASLLAETVTGLSCDAALQYVDNVRALLLGEEAQAVGVDLGKLKALAGVRDFPSRVKCATLAWHALDAAINSDTGLVSTE
ncbi:MAG: Fe-S cluster assembly sulfur transfer protein SufU [Woeseiaceae bacterium]